MNRIMQFRTVICFIFVLCMFLVCLARLTLITSEESFIQTAEESGSVKITLSKKRKNIFDTNGELLTGEEQKQLAVAVPSDRTVMYLSNVLSFAQKKEVLNTLNKGKPAVIQTNENMYCAGITNLKISLHESESKICDHLIGYTDSSLHGVSGLEKAFDSYLYTNDYAYLRYRVDGAGRILSGIEPETVLFADIDTCGIKTTIDKNIQLIAEECAQKINMGAIVITEAGTGKIRAMVSRPDFDSTNIAAYLNREDSPLINRCLMSYNVGSVFKLCVAAAALENGFSKTALNNCSGSTQIDGFTFYCHNRSGHGALDLSDAIKESCNTYFYEISKKVGAKNIYNTAKLFGFGNKNSLANSLYTSGESITSLKTLNQSQSSLANLSIGQGELLCSPLGIIPLYEAIACGGVYNTPFIVESVITDGEITQTFETPKPTRAISKNTADVLKQHLIKVVEEGTGKSAKPYNISAAGKTATAQTGRSLNGTPLEHSWFCGFFPVNEPKYIVSVFIENASLSDVKGADIFKNLAENITNLKELKD